MRARDRKTTRDDEQFRTESSPRVAFSNGPEKGGQRTLGAMWDSMGCHKPFAATLGPWFLSTRRRLSPGLPSVDPRPCTIPMVGRLARKAAFQILRLRPSRQAQTSSQRRVNRRRRSPGRPSIWPELAALKGTDLDSRASLAVIGDRILTVDHTIQLCRPSKSLDEREWLVTEVRARMWNVKNATRRRKNLPRWNWP